jgi:hypothetical protein
MKLTKITPWVIFALVLLLAWMTLGGSSGYYDGPQLLTAQPPAPGASSENDIKMLQALAQAPARAYTQRAWFLDYPGNDIGMITVKNRQGCARACTNTPGCVGFVMNGNESKCWRKTKMENPRWDWLRHSFALPSTSFPAPRGPPPKQPPKQVCMDISY